MAVVIDCGTDTTKAGLSGPSTPSVVFPTVVGIPKSNSSSPRSKTNYVGFEAENGIGRDVLDPEYPFEQGIITNWDAIEEIWHHIFDVEIRVSSDQCDVLMMDSPQNPRKVKEKTTQIMFETFNTAGFYLTSTALMSLYSVRKTCGLVLSSGEGVTHCVPIIDGSVLSHGIMKFDISGRDITDYLGMLLEENGYQFSSFSEKCVHARAIKEKFGYIADDFAEEMASPIGEEKYKLPDNTVIKIGKERFKCTEALFQPYLAGKETVGIHKFVYQSIMKCDEDIQNQLFENILLTGGTTLFPYFAARLQREISLFAPTDTYVNIIAKPERQNAAWTGGSILAEMSTFENMIILREEYDEYGPSIVRRKCN